MKHARSLAAGAIVASAIAGSLLLASPAYAADVVFADPALQACVNQQLGRPAASPVSTGQAAAMTDLSCNFAGITSLGGIESFTSLTALGLLANSISDLSPLGSLTHLTWLNLTQNQVTTIAPLSSLTALTWLSVRENQVTDLSPIGGLTQISYFGATSNQISDLSPLSGLTKLYGLDLADNAISDLAPLATLTALDGVTLEDNRIADLSPLGGLPTLHQVHATGQTLTLAAVAIGASTTNPLHEPHGAIITQVTGDADFVLAADSASWIFTAPAANTVTWAMGYPGPVFPAWQFSGTILQQSLAPAVHPTAIVDDTATTAAATPVTIDVLANDGLPGEPALDPASLTLLDAAGDPATQVSVAGGTFTASGGVVVFTPTAGFTGTAAAVSYQVANVEGVAGRAVITVTVTAAVVTTGTPTPTPTVTVTPTTPATLDPTAPATNAPGAPGAPGAGSLGSGTSGSGALASTGVAAWTISGIALLLATGGLALVLLRRKSA
ncbi:hypothetical protein VD659_03110 [Herbiconiux sp. 11R-BC]|uniref:Ig-like domain-containing protein n=1 Tax=Herbiconiux sp. 11R-BC TaxID=3111637 RepID=UPI003C032A08